MPDKEKMKHQPGQPDYGHNNPTGGTKESNGKLNPQGPTSGTENFHPDKKGGKQTAAHADTDENADDWAARTKEAANQTGNFGTGPVPANAGDVQDEGEDQHSFRCADAGFSDCRWETSTASSDQLWNEINRHAAHEHGMKSLDERTRGKIQDAIHVRRAA